mgnify:CR=1 FL=1
MTALLAGHVFEHSFSYAVASRTAATLSARLVPVPAWARAAVVQAS